MRKSARTTQNTLPVAQRRAAVGRVRNLVYPVLEARVFSGLGVEVHDQLAFLERVLAKDPDAVVLYLYDVVAGPSVASETRRGGGSGVHDEHVLDPPRVRHVLVSREDQVHVQFREELQDISRVEDDVSLAARTGDRDQMVMHHEDS